MVAAIDLIGEPRPSRFRPGTDFNHAVDLHRAALLFAGAGLDATLKQLLRDRTKDAIDGAGMEAFDTFVERHLRGKAGDVNIKLLGHYLARGSRARSELLTAYVEDLTGGSLQSSEQVLSVMAALGVRNDSLKRRVIKLKPGFTARNEIAHELDLADPQASGDSINGHRRPRPPNEILPWIHEMLEIAQLIMNEINQFELEQHPQYSAMTTFQENLVEVQRKGGPLGGGSPTD